MRRNVCNNENTSQFIASADHIVEILGHTEFAPFSKWWIVTKLVPHPSRASTDPSCASVKMFFLASLAQKTAPSGAVDITLNNGVPLKSFSDRSPWVCVTLSCVTLFLFSFYGCFSSTRRCAMVSKNYGDPKRSLQSALKVFLLLCFLQCKGL